MKKILPKELLSRLGSFWSSIVNSKALIRQMFAGVLSNHEQAELSVTELVTGVSSKEVTAGNTIAWHKFVFSSSSAMTVVYGDPSSSYGVSYIYGELDGTGVLYRLPENTMAVPFLYDDIVNPTKILCSGVDYIVQNGSIKFLKPLTYDTASITLYARNMQVDSGFVANRLGYLIDANLSDRVFRDVPFTLLWRMATYGATYADSMRLIGYCSGTPTTANKETILATATLDLCTLVITDFNCYAVPLDQTVSVQAGQVVPPGTFLSSNAKLLHNKQSLLSSEIPSPVNEGYVFRYGSEGMLAAGMIIVQANVKGELAGALRLLKRTLPLESRVFIFSHKAVAPATTSLSFAASNTTSVNGVTVPAASTTMQLQAKTMVKLKYNSSGY